MKKGMKTTGDGRVGINDSQHPIAKYINEDGVVDLSKATLREAVGYLNSLGMKFPIPTPGSKGSGVNRTKE